MKKPIVVEKFTDNGEHSHWELIHPETGKLLWSEDAQRKDSDLAGIEIISEERQRHFSVEGWTIEDDQKYTNGQLVDAAICYAMEPEDRKIFKEFFLRFWPWSKAWWKPTPDNRIKELAKAGALIAAEIDRLQNSPKIDLRWKK